MNKKIAVTLIGAATVMLAVSGCGGSGGKVDAYAKSVCDKWQPQLRKIQDANDSIASVAGGDHQADEVKKADSAAFQQMSDAYRSLAGAVDSAGAPPVDNGAQLQQNAVKQLNDTSASYAGLNKTVQGLDTSDQGKFAQGLNTVATQLGALNRSGDDALRKLQAGDVGAAMSRQPGCRKPSQAPSTAASRDSSGAASHTAPAGPTRSPAPTSTPSQSAAGSSASASAAASASGSPSASSSPSVATGTALGG